jgi:hypothetical protein
MDDKELDAMIAEVRAKSRLFDGSHVERDAPISDARLTEIESARGITFPSQYRRFLMLYGAGDFLYGTVYSANPDSGWSLWDESQYLQGIGKTLLPFSDNGCGDYLAFKVVDSVCCDRVYWADHERSYELTASEYQDFNTFVANVALRS